MTNEWMLRMGNIKTQQLVRLFTISDSSTGRFSNHDEAMSESVMSEPLRFLKPSTVMASE